MVREPTRPKADQPKPQNGEKSRQRHTGGQANQHEALPEPEGCEWNLGSQTLTWTGKYVLVSAGMFSTGVDPTPL